MNIAISKYYITKQKRLFVYKTFNNKPSHVHPTLTLQILCTSSQEVLSLDMSTVLWLFVLQNTSQQCLTQTEA